MEQVYLRYPEDREAAVFYGLAWNASAPPTDTTYANKRKAAEILNKVWAEQPNHPGVVHYLIHSDDSPQFAAAGLDAATCYSTINELNAPRWRLFETRKTCLPCCGSWGIFMPTY